MFKKPPSSAEPPLNKEDHPDAIRNKSDAEKLIKYWESKIKDHKSKLRFQITENMLYLSYNRVVSGLEYVYSSPHPLNQSWDEFRGSVTKCMRYCEVLLFRDDMNASGEWRKKHGVKNTTTKNSYHELFNY